MADTDFNFKIPVGHSAKPRPLAAMTGNIRLMKIFILWSLISLSISCFSQRNLDSLDNVNKNKVSLNGENLTKAVVNSDGFIWLRADIKKDHRFFGFEQPDTKSRRLILFSILTTDVKNNPFGCVFGSFYETANLDSLSLKYISRKGSFIKTKLVKKDSEDTVIGYIFFERKWFAFEKSNL